MEHKNLTLEYDRNVINKVLDDRDMKYVVLFLYVIRNDLFEDLNNEELIDSYQRVIDLEEVFKGNLLTFWKESFCEVAIDLGLIRNIRSVREFKAKEDDFIIKLGEETIEIEQNTIIVPEELIFLMIRKKFKFLTKRNYNLALTRLKSVRCEMSSEIHPFIFEIGEDNYSLSDDLYYILDQFGNIYQSIKIEVTIERFHERFKEIMEKNDQFIEIFDPILNNKKSFDKIKEAIENNKNIINYIKNQDIKLSEKFNFDTINKDAQIFKNWNSRLLQLLNFMVKLDYIDKKLLEIKNYYSGKKKKYSYLEFIEKVSFNENNIVDNMANLLKDLRAELIEIDKEISKLTRKNIKLLNLDFERFILTSEE